MHRSTPSASHRPPGPTRAPNSAAPQHRSLPRLGAILAVCCVAQFMIVLDSTIVTVALPDMRARLGLSADQQQWVVDSYLIALGGLLLLAARLGDALGHRRVFRFGLAVFTLASLAGGLADSGTLLIAARAVQGIGAAALAPASLSLISTTHADPAARLKGLALWNLAGGAAGAVGVVLGGLLTAELNWRWVLFVNVPVGVALYAASGAVLPRTLHTAPDAVPHATDGARQRRRLDVPGGLAATTAAAALTYGFSRAPETGWGSAQVLAPLLAAALLLVVFVLWETRSAAPLLPPAFFRTRRILAGNAVTAVAGATMTGSLVLITLYLQQGLGYSALRAGLALVPMAAVLVLGSLTARRLLPLLGPQALLAAGGVLTSGALAWFAALPTHRAYAAHLLGPSLLVGLGLGLMLLALTVTATSGVAPHDAGAASGLITTSRQLGGALGLSVLTSIAATTAAHAARTHTPLAAAVHGDHVAFLTDAAAMLLATLAALPFLHPHPRR